MRSGSDVDDMAWVVKKFKILDQNCRVFFFTVFLQYTTVLKHYAVFWTQKKCTKYLYSYSGHSKCYTSKSCTLDTDILVQCSDI